MTVWLSGGPGTCGALGISTHGRRPPSATTLAASASPWPITRRSPDVTDRAQTLRTELTVAGLTWLEPSPDLAVAFHHAGLGTHEDLNAIADRLRDSTTTGGYAYPHIAAAFGDLPRPQPLVQWLEDDHTVRERWRTLATIRQAHLRETSRQHHRATRPPCRADTAAPNP
ncbi:hypothetical protein [Streptomyces pacificus]|uniref:Uncharacterized protein n=1 Tax=Streptomyces pacificus TaxID=2705029 RepID=A0A6A0B2N1_9ACTN|nr:hypothetical protein [Streptomyces pacificus]GFH39392.1 hypothetical protein SCWH03_56590 [Streptomyces pacificus]